MEASAKLPQLLRLGERKRTWRIARVQKCVTDLVLPYIATGFIQQVFEKGADDFFPLCTPERRTSKIVGNACIANLRVIGRYQNYKLDPIVSTSLGMQ